MNVLGGIIRLNLDKSCKSFIITCNIETVFLPLIYNIVVMLVCNAHYILLNNYKISHFVKLLLKCLEVLILNHILFL